MLGMVIGRNIGHFSAVKPMGWDCAKYGYVKIATVR